MAEHRGGSVSPKTVKASDAGRKGGQHSDGNFKNDRNAHLKRVKGGQQSGGNKSGKS